MHELQFFETLIFPRACQKLSRVYHIFAILNSFLSSLLMVVPCSSVNMEKKDGNVEMDTRVNIYFRNCLNLSKLVTIIRPGKRAMDLLSTTRPWMQKCI